MRTTLDLPEEQPEEGLRVTKASLERQNHRKRDPGLHGRGSLLWMLIQVLCSPILGISVVCAQAFWERTNGPYGGEMRAIAVDAVTGTVYSGAYGSYLVGQGLFVSTDNGANWSERGNCRRNIVSVAAHSGRVMVCHAPNGFSMSTDHGFTWYRHPQIPDTSYAFLDVAMEDSLVLAVGFTGLYRSTDAGLTWQHPMGQYLNGVALQDSLALVCGQAGYLAMSSNRGFTWTTANAGLPHSPIMTVALQGTDLYASPLGQGVWRSTDFGNFWFPVNEGLTSDAHAVNNMATNDNHVYACTNDGAYILSEDRSFWTLLGDGLKSSCVMSMAFKEDQMFASTLGADGVYRSGDGGHSWVPANRGIDAQLIESIVAVGQTVYAATNRGGVYSSTDRGNTWRPCMTLHNLRAYDLAVRGTDICATFFDRIATTTDGGNSWSEFLQDQAGGSHYAGCVWTEREFYVGSWYRGVSASFDDGATWMSMNMGLPNPNIKDLELHDGLLFAGLNLAGVFMYDPIGQVWQSRNNGIVSANVTTLTSNGDYLFAAGLAPAALYRSSDKASSWNTLNIGNPSGVFLIRSIVARGPHIFVGIHTLGLPRVLVSHDYGDSWTDIGFGLGGMAILPLALDVEDHLYVGTENGIFRSANKVTGIGSVLPHEGGFELGSNYPNPFNPTTTISFRLPVMLPVRLTVYDAVGREVRTLLNKRVGGGQHVVQWDGQDDRGRSVASGVYFYRLKAGGFLETRKMLLMR